MNIKYCALVVILLGNATIIKADDRWLDYLNEPAEKTHSVANLPFWVVRHADENGIASKYGLSLKMNPFYLPGDFDGNGELDYAVWIENRETHELGIAFFVRETQTVHIVGAGTPFENMGGNFDWADFWQIVPKGVLRDSHWEKEPPTAQGAAIMTGKSESSSAAIYWNGVSFVWYQVSD